MLDQFIRDLQIPDTIVQIGRTDQILGTATSAEDVENILHEYQEENLYFLGGVDPARGLARAGDDHVVKKNYIYFDLDIRKDFPDCTDDDIITMFAPTLKARLDGSSFDHWRYIVFTGNGLHVYFFSEDPVSVTDKQAWKTGMKLLINALEELSPDDNYDTACTNLSRIGRIPGSFNQKSDPPKPVKILFFNDKYTNLLHSIEEKGKEEVDRAIEETRRKQEEMAKNFPDDGDLFHQIDQIPVENLVSRIIGCDAVKTADGKIKFNRADWDRLAGFYVPANGKNCVYPGGSSHMDNNSCNGYSPYMFIKHHLHYPKLIEVSANEVFTWFKENYPHLKRDLLDYEKTPDQKLEATKQDETHSQKLFGRLKNIDFQPIKIMPELDNKKLLIRGAVTRIGAMSYTGKSKMGYWLCHRVLQNGYKAMIVSTEVPAEIVLANMLMINMDCSIWDLINHTVEIPPDIERKYDSLKIYDVKDTMNSLEQVEEIIKKNKEGEGVDFVLVDYCQMMQSKQFTNSEFHAMSRYAFEIQAMAQQYECCILDISQLNEAGIKDEGEKYGIIPFKNSKDLYNAADIAIMLKRDRSPGSESNTMQCSVRKHKYMQASTFDLEYNWKNGSFALPEADVHQAAASWSIES